MNPETLKATYEPKPTGKEVTYERQLWQARYSPCGKFLIACGYDATVQRWDVTGEEPKLLDPLTGHNGWVQCMDFAQPGGRLFTADSWGQLACWSYEQAKPTTAWKLPQAHDGWIRALAVSPDGSLVATGGNDAVVRLWEANSGKLTKELTHPDASKPPAETPGPTTARIFSLCFHPDGKSLAMGDLEGTIHHWDLASDKIVRKLEAKVLYSHDVESERIQHCGGVRHLSFDADGKRLVCTGQKTPGGGFATGTPCAIVFDWQTGKQLREMPVGSTQDGFAYDARFHASGFVMATSCAFPGKGHVWFWRPEDDKAFYTSNKIPNGRSLSLHPDGRKIALMVSISPNANGRPLKDGDYIGGSSKIHILEFPAPEA